jgi:hypothetical protein
MEIFFGQIKVSRQLLYGLEPFIYTKEKTLYIIALVPAFFITSVLRSFLFYDPTIGFGLDIVTSDIIGIVIAILITILFFVVMKNKNCLNLNNWRS